MERQVNSMVSSANYHLRNIRKIRLFLDFNASKAAVNAFVISRLDNQNSLLAGVNKEYMKKLKSVQNAAARVVLRKEKRANATPMLKSLHWLPCCSKRGKRYYRVEYKYLVLTFKALNGSGPKYLSDLLTIHEPPKSTAIKREKVIKSP